jgi:hypothetical protein
MKLWFALFAGVLVASMTQIASATIIVNDNFTYANQAALEASWAPIGTAGVLSTQLSTVQAASPTQSAQVPGHTATNGQYRNRKTFAETSTFSTSGNMGIGDQLIWSFNFHDASAANAPQRNYANLQDSTAPGATNQLISMGLNNNLASTAEGGNYYMARILGANSNGGTAGAYFKLNDAGAPLRSTGWHNLKVVITTDDGLSTDYRFYVDNTLAETALNVSTAANIRSFDNIAMGSGFTNGGVAAYFDDMYLEYIPAPEPSSLALLGLGAAAVLRRRRAS